MEEYRNSFKTETITEEVDNISISSSVSQKDLGKIEPEKNSTAKKSKDSSNMKAKINIQPDETTNIVSRPSKNPSTKPKISRLSPAMNNFSRAVRAKDAFIGALKTTTIDGEFEKTPFRCIAMRANYSWTPTLLFLMYFYTASTFYGEEPMKCIDRFDKTPATEKQIDICLHYPFTRSNKKWPTEENKIFALHYMWTHWMFLLVALVYKIVQVACCLAENTNLNEFIKSLQATENYNIRFFRAVEYFRQQYGNHKWMFSRIVLLHFVAITVNLIGFFMIDFFLSFKYTTLPLLLLETRDFTFFDDKVSTLFPPFAECEISPKMHILTGRTYYLGCHLPLNEIYEKFFMFLWFWQVGLAVFTIGSLFLWFMCALRKEMSLNCEEIRNFKETSNILRALPINEIFVLNLVKPYLFGSHFRHFVFALSKWDRANEDLFSISSDYEIYMPTIRKNMNLIEEDTDALTGLVESVFDTAADMGIHRGNSSHRKIKPSAPPENERS